MGKLWKIVFAVLASLYITCLGFLFVLALYFANLAGSGFA